MTMARTPFAYESYKQFVNDWIAEQPKEGYGQLKKMAEAIKVHSVVLSQVFRGDRDLTCEQAIALAKFIGLSELERDYFLLQVQHARAGTVELKKVLEKQLSALKHQSSSIKNRIQHQGLSDSARATFYSHWYYSAISLGLSIPQFGNAQKVADELGVDRAVAAEAVRFLIETQINVEKNGKFDLGPRVTHVGHDSPHVFRHHTNWRLRALQSLESKNENNLHYTGPMALSAAAAEEIREELIKLIERATAKAARSDSEVLRCLTLDWFRINGR